jgi:hypothetical protein
MRKKASDIKRRCANNCAILGGPLVAIRNRRRVTGCSAPRQRSLARSEPAALLSSGFCCVRRVSVLGCLMSGLIRFSGRNSRPRVQPDHLRPPCRRCASRETLQRSESVPDDLARGWVCADLHVLTTFCAQPPILWADKLRNANKQPLSFVARRSTALRWSIRCLQVARCLPQPVHTFETVLAQSVGVRGNAALRRYYAEIRNHGVVTEETFGALNRSVS